MVVIADLCEAADRAPRYRSLTHRAPVADEVDMKGVRALRRHERAEIRVSGVCTYFHADKPQAP